jgi:hypothetical protein
MDADAVTQYYEAIEREARGTPATKPRLTELVPVEYRTDVLDDGAVVHVLVE